MADLLAKTDTKSPANLKLERNQEVQGEVILLTDSEIILDLGSKAEGVLSKKDFSAEVSSNLKPGDKVSAFVIRTENESGQVVLGL
ncbi:S1 RNA-binding domain-containing protein, partial [Candidatus Daviesbacteria bacterium]|nr:S1 RNA-binding domain-containing protein [Candidatus Daviesbacteria bacterium]